MRDNDVNHGSIPGGVEAAYSRGKDETGKPTKGGRMARKGHKRHGGKKSRKHGHKK